MVISGSHIINLPSKTIEKIFHAPSNFKPSSSNSNKIEFESIDHVDHEPSAYDSRHDFDTISNECFKSTLRTKLH